MKKNKLETMRHSCSHLMAMAVMQIFPKAKLAIGPAIENGFYYDFELDRPLIEADLKKIEKLMYKIQSLNDKFIHEEWNINQALKFFKSKNQKYKVELINDLIKENPKLKKVSVYKSGDFVDLCAGPHVALMKEIGPFRLLSIAGAYWRGDEKNKMLQRIYGTCFPTEKELNSYLHLVEEAKKRDHRALGEKLDIFSINDEFGAGLPLWHPNGAMLRKFIKDYLSEELIKDGYLMVETPHIAKLDLWKTSGHWGFYRENMYQPFKAEAQEFLVKPMNCPGHIKIYETHMHSYKELPIKYAEFGTVYRFEKSGVLHGLMRVRGFTQDDAHVFCRPDQIETEIKKLVKFAVVILKKFGFKEYEVYLSTRPEKSVGSEQNWNKATRALESALKSEKIKYQIDPGEGVFYGPKIDIKIKDSLGRLWQCTTIQVDFNLPERFKMFYIDKKSQKIQPIMIHRAILGSLERFIGVLIEHHKGEFPLWLAPVQIKILTIGKSNIKYGREIYNKLKDLGLRVQINAENETLPKKIRTAELQKIPYVLVVGDREMKNKTVAVRLLQKGDIGAIKFDKFSKDIIKEVVNKS